MPAPPVVTNEIGMAVGYTDTIFMGWACLDNSALTRAQKLAGICQRADQSLVNRRPVER